MDYILEVNYEKINENKCFIEYDKTGYADYLSNNYNTIYYKNSSSRKLWENQHGQLTD